MIPGDRRKIGGADIAALLGLSPWAKPSDVWLRIVKGEGASVAGIAEDGLDLEPGIFSLIRRRRPAEYIEHPTLEHPTFKGGVGHLDLLDKAGGCVVDAKAIHWRARDKWSDGQGGRIVPEHVRLQLDWYMVCAGAESAQIGAFFGLGEFEMIPVAPLDFDTRGQILEVAQKFWVDHIETGIPPPPDGGAGYGVILGERLAQLPETPVCLPPEADAVVAEYLAARSGISALTKRKELAAQQLEAMLVEAGSRLGLAGGARIKKTTGQSRSTNWEALAMSFEPSTEEIERFSVLKNRPLLTVNEVKK